MQKENRDRDRKNICYITTMARQYFPPIMTKPKGFLTPAVMNLTVDKDIYTTNPQ